MRNVLLPPAPGRRGPSPSTAGRALTIDSGWRKVCDTALTFVERFVQPGLQLFVADQPRRASVLPADGLDADEHNQCGDARRNAGGERGDQLVVEDNGGEQPGG